MFNIFSLSIEVPNLYQFLAIFFLGINIVLVGAYAIKINKSEKSFKYILYLLIGQLIFSTIWKSLFKPKIEDILILIDTIQIIGDMHDILIFNLIIFPIVVYLYLFKCT